MSTATTIRPAPPVIRNGLPGWKPYVYRGRGYDVLTPELGDAWADTARPVEVGEPCWCDGSMRAYRKHLALKEDPCGASRAEVNAYTREQRQRNQCDTCGYSVTGPNHRILCGGAA